MSRHSIQQLLDDLESQIIKAERFFKENEKTSNEVIKASSASWSAGGDVLYAQGQAKVVKENLDRLIAFRDEVKVAIKSKKPELISPVCFVKIKYQNIDKPAEFYLVSEPVYLSGYKFVSADSTLGKMLLGKKEGDKVTCQLENPVGKVNADFEILKVE